MDAIDPLDGEGRLWLRNALSTATLAHLDAASAAQRGPGLRLSAATALACDDLNATLSAVFPGAIPVRVVAFNKSEEVNWALPWHQDRVVALRERHLAPGFDNWTRKDGVWHAEPPLDLLERMVFARVHLDASTLENGCLELALGTHKGGKVSSAAAAIVAEGAPREMCIAQRGDILIVKALILHRSSASRSTALRRTLRIDYCAETLPAPLAWAA